MSASVKYWYLSRMFAGMSMKTMAPVKLSSIAEVKWGFKDVRNIIRSESLVSPEERESLLGQKGATVWLTGLSASGKSTIARQLEQRLTKQGRLCYILDGDNVRHGLNRDLGFSPEDRTENIRRIGEVANLMMDAGTICLTAFISPYRADRDSARSVCPDGDFIEVYCQCALEECERRDPKGLYKKARAGEIPNFTGISAPYEEPEDPELVLDTDLRLPALHRLHVGFDGGVAEDRPVGRIGQLGERDLEHSRHLAGPRHQIGPRLDAPVLQPEDHVGLAAHGSDLDFLFAVAATGLLVHGDPPQVNVLLATNLHPVVQTLLELLHGPPLFSPNFILVGGEAQVHLVTATLQGAGIHFAGTVVVAEVHQR